MRVELKLNVEIKNIHGLAVFSEKKNNTFKGRLFGKIKKKKQNKEYFCTGRNNVNTDKLKNLSYKEYLQTEHWIKIKKYVFKKYGKLCLMCGTKDSLHVHHKTYKNKGNYEKEKNDCIVLCGMCHAKEHDIIS